MVINTDPESKRLGKGVEEVPELSLKTTESDGALALRGLATKVMDGYFWIDLFGDDESSLAVNQTMLRNDEWFELDLVLEGGKKANLTFPKGTAGRAAMEEALAAWGTVAVKQ